jgi:predicted nucleic acid-binding protein
VSALARRERDGLLTPEGADDALTRLDALRERWDEIEPAETVRRTARRLLRVHPLRGGDALQLAAALVASEGDPAALAFVSLDERLAVAAQREGFHVVPQQQV